MARRQKTLTSTFITALQGGTNRKPTKAQKFNVWGAIDKATRQSSKAGHRKGKGRRR